MVQLGLRGLKGKFRVVPLYAKHAVFKNSRKMLVKTTYYSWRRQRVYDSAPFPIFLVLRLSNKLLFSVI